MIWHPSGFYLINVGSLLYTVFHWELIFFMTTCAPEVILGRELIEAVNRRKINKLKQDNTVNLYRLAHCYIQTSFTDTVFYVLRESTTMATYTCCAVVGQVHRKIFIKFNPEWPGQV